MRWSSTSRPPGSIRATHASSSLRLCGLSGGRLADEPFRRLINPGEPIPPAATRLHGIDDARVAGALGFAAVWPEFSEVARRCGVIGHTIGFDLAVLARECERAGLAWKQPQTLDTRLLAEIAEPALADFSLESLASWLGVEITDRHSALGDARAAARYLPRARCRSCARRNIRTLAEAARACRSLTKVLDEQHRAGWTEAVPPNDAAMDRARGSTAIRTAIAQATSWRRRVSSRRMPRSARARRNDEEPRSHRCSSGSRRSARGHRHHHRARHHARARGTTAPRRSRCRLTQAMSNPLAVVPADAFAYLAVSRMNRLKVRHLGVTDEAGKVVGALSARDLLRLRAEGGCSSATRSIRHSDVHDLGLAWGHVARVAADLVREGLSGREIAAVISRELGAMTHRAAVLAEQPHAGRRARAPRPALTRLWCSARPAAARACSRWIRTTRSCSPRASRAALQDRWFAALGTHVADILHEVGVPYCTGGVMAKNAAWRGSLTTWRERVRHWIGRSNPQDLLSVDIFFDLRGVHGDASLANALWREAFDRAAGEAAFAKLLAETAGAVAPALNWFGRFKTDKGRIDLKKAGLFGIVSTARALAIRHHVVERATSARLAGREGRSASAGSRPRRADRRAGDISRSDPRTANSRHRAGYSGEQHSGHKALAASRARSPSRGLPSSLALG